MFFTYILQSAKTGRYYVGSTVEVTNRLREHNNGESASTRHGIPWELVHVESFETRVDASRKEKQIKGRGIGSYVPFARKKVNQPMQPKFRSHILSVFAIVAIISGCKNNVVQTGTDDPFSALPADPIVGPSTPIDSKTLFSFTEYINPAGRTTSLFFRTERIYGMAGYRIVSNVTREGNRISVRLDSIQAPEAGAAIFSPATSSFDLGALSNDLYSMNISINGKTVAALLLLSDTSFITKVQPNNLVTTSRPRLLRVPQTIVWGQAESISPSTYQLFLDSLVILGATSATLLTGDYFYFSINTDGSFSIPSALGFHYGRHFLYRFDADTSISRSLVKRFAKRYQDSVYVQLTGGRGEMYYTTVLKWEP